MQPGQSAPAPAAPAPGGDGGAPAAPVAPVAPAAPTAPPAAPGTPAPVNPNPAAPAPQATQPTAQEAADADAESQWDAAHNEIFPGLKSTQKKEPAKNEPAKPEETTETTTATTQAPTGQEQPAQPGAGDDTAAQGASAEGQGDKPTQSADAAAREARATARAIAQQTDAMRTDVRSKMFADAPTRLQDKDGDPINTVEDVMARIDPRTGEAFTQEAAQEWLNLARDQLASQVAETNRQVERIAEVNLVIKDEADAINEEFGEYLKAHPEERDALWAEYNKSLVVDPTTKIILNAPVSLAWFYRQVLGPRVAAATPPASTTPPAPGATTPETTTDPAAAKAAADAAKQASRADRSDIYQPPANPTPDADEGEWDKAHAEVFPNYKPKK